MIMNKKLYSVWAMMKQRCMNPRCRLFEWYGGRGIKVCPEWATPNGYWAFELWSRSGYKDGLTIDRKDSDGDYEPSNCRWITRVENLRNRKMTPKWYAHIKRIQEMASTLPKTEAQTNACRKNIEKARLARLERIRLKKLTNQV